MSDAVGLREVHNTKVSWEIEDHCSRCRKAFSGASSAYALVQADSHRWTSGEEELKRYKTGAGWELAFCANCGSTLAGIFDGRVHGVTLGTVNGDPNIEFEYHIYVGSKAPWDHIGGTALRHIAELSD